MKKIILILSLIFLSLAQASQAVDLYFNSDSINIKMGRFFEVNTLIDSQYTNINAVEGSIYFPIDLLDFIDVKESDSIINFWIEKPDLVKNGIIKFSGIIPGGYSGQGSLFKIIFKSKQSGQGSLTPQKIKVLLNDGLGTEASLSKQSLYFEISKQAPLAEDVVIVDLSDQDLPEPFTPVISKIPEIAGDNYLLMFNTQDKGSGVAYYKVKEGFYPFIKAVSPYLLKNQNLDRKILVKAVDKSGNERIVTIAPVYSSPWYEDAAFFAIIIVAIIIAFSFGMVLWIKTKRKQK